ncbi:hypothetical protein EI94DRAFT_1711674 [Lactarius quietus]|nr:hypothetical protein EI94DRAFT_1711674 [Lactarius quietus]
MTTGSNRPSCLVQLMMGEGMLRQQSRQPRQDEGKRCEAAPLQRKVSFYPGLNGVNSILDVESNNIADSINNEAQFEEEDDWIDVQSTVEPSCIQTSKFSEALALEQPMWKVSDLTAGLYKLPFHFPARDSGTGLTVSTAPSRPLSPPLPPSSPNMDEVVMPKPTSSPLPSPSTAQTDLRFVPGLTRIILTGQRPIVHMVIQEAIDNVWASLLFVDAFSDSNCALKQCPAAADVLKRLQEDDEYMLAIVPLPRARISIMRGEVKDCLVVMTQTTFRGKASPMEAAAYIQEQLSNYNYTYPRGPRMCSKPYRNDRIIGVIWDLYFTGGHTSFAYRFDYRFPRCENCENVRKQVPDVMVALAATALYAVLYEWRTGHMNTLKEIWTRWSGAYHTMMADIYCKQISHSNTSTSSAGAPLGVIDFQELEE